MENQKVEVAEANVQDIKENLETEYSLSPDGAVVRLEELENAESVQS